MCCDAPLQLCFLRPLNAQAYLEQPLGFEPLMQAQRPFEAIPVEPDPAPSEHKEAKDADDKKVTENMELAKVEDQEAKSNWPRVYVEWSKHFVHSKFAES